MRSDVVLSKMNETTPLLIAAEQNSKGSVKQHKQKQQQKQNGPVKRRSCTDVLCLVLFVGFISFWLCMIGYFAHRVDILRTLHPTDSFGNVCGTGNFTDRPYLVYFNILTCGAALGSSIVNGCPTMQVCVQQCPNVTFSVNDEHKSANVRSLEAANAVCLYDAPDPTDGNIQELVQRGDCARYYFNSDSLGGRCIPSVVKLIHGETIMNDLTNEPMLSLNGSSITADRLVQNQRVLALMMKTLTIGTNIAGDLAQSWRWILGGLGLAMVLSLVWIHLMQCLAWPMVWLSILAVLTLNSAGLYSSIVQYQLSNNTHQVTQNHTLDIDLNLGAKLKAEIDTLRHSVTLWLVLSLVLGALLAILILVILFLFRRIQLSIAIIEEASKAIGRMRSTLFFPIGTFLLKVSVMSLWVLAVLIIACGTAPQYRDSNDAACVPPVQNRTIEYDSDSILEVDLETQNCTLRQPFSHQTIYAAHGLNLFALIWILFFLMDVTYLTLSGAFASYYWTGDKKRMPNLVLLRSLGRTIRYHLGSLAFGSLILAVLRFVRILFELGNGLYKRVAHGTWFDKLMAPCKILFCCLEGLVKFANRNAYIMIAVHGRGFCASAREAFRLIVHNPVRTLVLNYICGFLLFLSKVTITGAVGATALATVNNQLSFMPFDLDLHYYWAPVVLLLLLVYLITDTFFSVYHVAIETIFLCFLEDCRLNDGSPEKPYFMAHSLADVFNHHHQ